MSGTVTGVTHPRSGLIKSENKLILMAGAMMVFFGWISMTSKKFLVSGPLIKQSIIHISTIPWCRVATRPSLNSVTGIRSQNITWLELKSPRMAFTPLLYRKSDRDSFLENLTINMPIVLPTWSRKTSKKICLVPLLLKPRLRDRTVILILRFQTLKRATIGSILIWNGSLILSDGCWKIFRLVLTHTVLAKLNFQRT